MFLSYFTRENILNFLGLATLFLLLGLGQNGGRPPLNKVAGTPLNDTFYQSLQRLEGQRLAGRTIYPTGQRAPFAGQPIHLEVARCTKNEMRMPLYVGGKVYRTLILERTPTGSFLKHEDKTALSVAPVTSLNEKQRTDPAYGPLSPADAANLPWPGPPATSVWTLTFNSDQSRFSYLMERDGQLQMQIDFDLPAYLAVVIP